MSRSVQARQQPPATVSSKKPAGVVRERRGTRQERGYTDAWIEYSRAYRRDHPLCEECSVGAKVVSASCVDHIIPVSGPDDPRFFDPENHCPLCNTCHSRKTSTIDGGFGNEASRITVHPGRFAVCGLNAALLDGWIAERKRPGDKLIDLDAGGLQKNPVPLWWRAQVFAWSRSAFTSAVAAREIGAYLVHLADDAPHRS